MGGGRRWVTASGTVNVGIKRKGTRRGVSVTGHRVSGTHESRVNWSEKKGLQGCSPCRDSTSVLRVHGARECHAVARRAPVPEITGLLTRVVFFTFRESSRALGAA